MRTVTATTASRGFSALLDAVEHGDSVTITRGGHPIAEIRPLRRRTLGHLRSRLAELPPLDDDFERDVADALSLVETEERDPWGDA